jgi:hypothetical protein
MKIDPTPKIAQLAPGTYIPPDELEHWLGEVYEDVSTPLARTDPSFDPLVVRLAKRIEHERPDLVTRIRQHGIEVLTDQQKILQSVTERQVGVRKLLRSVMINQRTNPALLSPEERSKLDHATRVNAAVALTAIKETKRLTTRELLGLPAPPPALKGSK